MKNGPTVMFRKLILTVTLFVSGFFYAMSVANASLQELRAETENWLKIGAPAYLQPSGLKTTEYADWYVGHALQCGTRIWATTLFTSRLLVPFVSAICPYAPIAQGLGTLVQITFIVANIDQALAPAASFNLAKQSLKYLVFWNFDNEQINKPIPNNPFIGALDGGSAITLAIISDSNKILATGQFPNAPADNEQIQINLWVGEVARFYVRSQTLPLVYCWQHMNPLLQARRAPRRLRNIAKSTISFTNHLPNAVKAILPMDVLFNTERMLNNRIINFNIWSAVRGHVFFWETPTPTSVTMAAKMLLRPGYNIVKLPVRFVYDAYLLMDEVTKNVN